MTFWTHICSLYCIWDRYLAGLQKLRVRFAGKSKFLVTWYDHMIGKLLHQENHTLLYWLYKASIKPEKLHSLKLHSLGSFFEKLQEIKPVSTKAVKVIESVKSQQKWAKNIKCEWHDLSWNLKTVLSIISTHFLQLLLPDWAAAEIKVSTTYFDER